MVLRLSLVLRQNGLREPKALHLIERAIDVLTGARQRVEAPGDDPEVDGERQPQRSSPISWWTTLMTWFR